MHENSRDLCGGSCRIVVTQTLINESRKPSSGLLVTRELAAPRLLNPPIKQFQNVASAWVEETFTCTVNTVDSFNRPVTPFSDPNFAYGPDLSS